MDGWISLAEDPFFATSARARGLSPDEAAQIPPIRSFELVDEKLAESDFFLEEIRKRSLDLRATQYLFSAFCSSTRSVTFSLQAVMSKMDGFADWYQTWRDTFKQDDLANFFVQARNVTQKTGETPIRGGSWQGKEVKLHFAPSHDLPRVPSEDVVTCCRHFLLQLVTLTYDAYVTFGPLIDPQQHYTKAHFESQGRTVDDADEEIMGMRGYTAVPRFTEEERWEVLRKEARGINIVWLFEKYLGRFDPVADRVSRTAK